jgi:hypothetical protein
VRVNRSDAEELLALEARGVEMSRNRNFHLFEEEGPRRALKLRRRLDYLIRMIHRHRHDPSFAITVDAVAGKLPLELCITLTVLSATLSVRLDAQEMRILLRDAEVAAVLADIDLPDSAA